MHDCSTHALPESIKCFRGYARKFVTLDFTTCSFVVSASYISPLGTPTSFPFPLSVAARKMSPEAHPSSDIEAQKTDVLDMPSHWIFKRDGHPLNHTYFCWWPPLHFLHHLMCAIGWGHGSLVEFWELCHPRCPLEVWEHERDLVGGRLEHLNTVVRSEEHTSELQSQ